MKIDCGKYILQTDSFKNMWIEEKYMGETKDKEPKESTRRVSGYLMNIHDLAQDFMEKGFYGADVDNMNDLLAKLRMLQDEIDIIANKYNETELKKHRTPKEK